MQKSTLLLLPNLISEDSWELIAPRVEQEMEGITAMIGETPKELRKYISHFLPGKVRDIEQHCLNEHSTNEEIKELIKKIKLGGTFGLVSDAGMPAIADPGSILVKRCHEEGIAVRAIMGPSSILIALMLSGFSGQRFSFQGYLPKKEEELSRELKRLESISKKEQMTQIWIETPYRSDKMMKHVIENLQPTTYFCVASDLTGKGERVISLPIAKWRKQKIQLGKEPTVFLLFSP